MPLSILTASVLGSGHCLAMCGGIVLAVAPQRTQQLRYHLGRLTGYLVLGGVAGALGEWVFDEMGYGSWGSLVGVLILGGALVLLGLSQLFLHPSGQNSWVPSRLKRQVASLARFLLRRGPFAMGLASVLLPCGWLYGFVILAGASGSWWMGMATLLPFWLGTVPALWLAPQLIQPLLQRLGWRRSAVVGFLFVSVGLGTVVWRSVPVFEHMLHPAGKVPASEVSCHS